MVVKEFTHLDVTGDDLDSCLRDLLQDYLRGNHHCQLAEGVNHLHDIGACIMLEKEEWGKNNVKCCP